MREDLGAAATSWQPLVGDGARNLDDQSLGTGRARLTARSGDCGNPPDIIYLSSPRLSFTAEMKSCSAPKYRSVV